MSPDTKLAAKAQKLLEKLDHEAKAAGYHLNPDRETTIMLCEGLVTNAERYGYMSCPCRLATEKIEADLDIICPCDYRDPDLTDYNACYCSLYVSQGVVEGKEKIGSIPERRPPREKRKITKAVPQKATLSSLPLPVWRCKVCGYLCARDGPPEVCPICKAKKERFERFI